MNLGQALLQARCGLTNRALEERSPANANGFKNHSKIVFFHKGKAPIKKDSFCRGTRDTARGHATR